MADDPNNLRNFFKPPVDVDMVQIMQRVRGDLSAEAKAKSKLSLDGLLNSSFKGLFGDVDLSVPTNVDAVKKEFTSVTDRTSAAVSNVVRDFDKHKGKLSPTAVRELIKAKSARAKTGIGRLSGGMEFMDNLMNSLDLFSAEAGGVQDQVKEVYRGKDRALSFSITDGLMQEEGLPKLSGRAIFGAEVPVSYEAMNYLTGKKNFNPNRG
jgi:hypothetical protein